VHEGRKEPELADQPGAEQEWSGLKIIGAGFGRTGTLSLKYALEELGFRPCYHMTELFSKPGASEMWEAIARGAPVDWNTVFAGYQATVDWPACAFYKELMQAYPEAKVLLTVREPEKWYESARNTIYQVTDRNRLSPHARMINSLIWEGTFDCRFEDKAYAIAIFQRHIEEVRQFVPAEKLLVYAVKEGWEPLCAFLGVKVPVDTPFPHLNDREEFMGRVRSHQQ
jgi:Sulfotransferase domain